MQAGRDSTRRNRNIGTSRRGHGRNNKLVLPIRYFPISSYYYERLDTYCVVHLDIGARQFTFLVEETRAGSYHACTPEDVAHLLRHVKPDDLDGIELIILRQPKRKEEILSPAWGRWVPYITIDEKFRGSAIILEAVPLDKPIRWAKSLVPEDARELNRLKADGHRVKMSRRHHIILLSLESVRSTQLYRTLLHEIGHHVDYSRNKEAFDRKLMHEKEVFANRYAEVLLGELEAKRITPFDRIFSTDLAERLGLRISDFTEI